MEGQLERNTAVGDQVVARISVSGCQGGLSVVSRQRGVRHCRGLSGNLDLSQTRASGQIFDRVPVVIARREVHFPEQTLRPKDLVDQADAFDELGPVEP